MFEFLEVNQDEHKEQTYHENIIKEIPDNQRLSISDLKIIKPDIKVLKTISKKILDKYSIVPLYIALPNSRPNLPKHLNKEYWGTMNGQKNFVLYVASPEPFDNHILNILRSISDYSVIAVPIIHKDAVSFLNEDYQRIVLPENISQTKKKINYDVLSTIKDNISYIIFFILILIGLISIKFLIEK